MGAIKKVGEALQDGWMNFIAMMGVSNKDKRVSHEISWRPLTQVDAENLYAGDDSAQKVVDEVVDDGIREWIALKSMEEELKKAVMARHDALMVRERFAEAWRWARLYGGSAIVPLFKGDSDVTRLAQPMTEKPGELKGLLVLNRWELSVDEIDEDIMSTNFGYPKTYTVSPQSGTSGTGLTSIKIHYTRLLRFDGAPLPRKLFVTNNYWHDSVLNRAKDAIRDYNFAYDSANAVLGDFSVSKFKLKGLAELIAAGKESEVKQRLEIAAISKSVLRAVAIDADGEDWEEVARSMTGVPEVMAKASQRMVAASKLPHTKMLGESPSGLGATGRSEERNYYDYVKFRQVLDVQRNLDRVLNWIIADVSNGSAPSDWSWEFKTLWQLTETEKADVYVKQAQADALYIDKQVLDPEEVAKSRFDKEDTEIELTLERTPEVSSTEQGETTGSNPNVQKLSLNGAQVASLVEVLGQVAIGNLPRESAVALIRSAFSIDPTEVDKILGNVGKGFNPTDPALLVGNRSTTDEDPKPTKVQTLILSKERFKTAMDARQWASRNGYATTKIDETEDSYRFRQMEPTEFAQGSFRTIEMSNGVQAVLGHLKG